MNKSIIFLSLLIVVVAVGLIVFRLTEDPAIVTTENIATSTAVILPEIINETEVPAATSSSPLSTSTGATTTE